MNLKELREAAKSIAHAAIEAVEPEALVRKAVAMEGTRLGIDDCTIDLADFSRVFVVGAGKASASMGKALEGILGKRITGGIIVVKDGHARPLERVKVLHAGHPAPDERGVEAARQICSLLRHEARPDTLVFCLISGGGSALLPLPHATIPLDDKRNTTRLLLECGASIDEINTVRKHISRVKGGQLAKVAAPSRVISLILSDVIGDALDVIASGPTVGDSSTFSDAERVLEKYGIRHKLPDSVRIHIQRGLRGEISETPSPEDPIFDNVTNRIIGSNRSAVEAASARAAALGFKPIILSTCMSGEAREVGTVLASIAIEAESSGRPAAPPVCILAGGETTVTIRGKGKGGRNQELALSAAIVLDKSRNIVISSVGTDGTDGPTDAAGGIVDSTTVSRARAIGMDPVEYLWANDSYHFLEKVGDLLITGPTGTNVMDLLLALVAC